MDIVGHILKLCAGIGIFLFAMYLQEEALKNLSGRRFKILLQRVTRNRLGAVAGGIIITVLLQSSSIVTLMVLAFVGAGIFTLRNALGIILGANLGSTLYNWIVVSLGFKFNLELVAYPLVCIGGLLIVLTANRKYYMYLSYFLLGFGLLFIGLGYMKSAMEAQAFDFSGYAGNPLAVYLLVGFIITLIVQSSSVTMALTLSALSIQAVSFSMAVAIVLGSETGTTIKILIGTIGGSVAKKRVGLGGFLFNVLLTIVAFLLIHQIIHFIVDILRIHDPLIGLVFFSSFVNLLGIIVFLPFLDLFTKLLSLCYKDAHVGYAAYISDANIGEPQTALDLFRRETEYFIHNSMLFNLELFKAESGMLQSDPKYLDIRDDKKFKSGTREEMYEFLKHHQGELQTFYLRLRSRLEGEQNIQLNQLIAAVRSSMYAVKSINDVTSNLDNLKRSSKDVKFELFLHHKREITALYSELFLLQSKGIVPKPSKFHALFNNVRKSYGQTLNEFYRKAQTNTLQELDITTAINFNRAFFTSNKAMIMSLKDLLLADKEAQDFDALLAYSA